MGPLYNGGCTFAERPDLAAPDATIIWTADYDPATLRAEVDRWNDVPGDMFDLNELRPWLAATCDEQGVEHIVLSDRWRHIRLDIVSGRASIGTPMQLRYQIGGFASAEAPARTLQRLLHLRRYRRFGRSLFPPDARMSRSVLLLRVHDAEQAQASQREIAQALFGEGVSHDWRESADSLRSRVRRLIHDARSMAAGGYRALMRPDRPGRS